MFGVKLVTTSGSIGALVLPRGFPFEFSGVKTVFYAVSDSLWTYTGPVFIDLGPTFGSNFLTSTIRWCPFVAAFPPVILVSEFFVSALPSLAMDLPFVLLGSVLSGDAYFELTSV